METLGEIIERVRWDLGATKDLFTEKTALAFAIAGCSFMLRDHLDLSLEATKPENAKSEALDEWVARLGLKRKDRVRAIGFCAFYGVSGSTIPLGTRLGFGEVLFETTEEKTIPASCEVKIAIQSLHAGRNTNLRAQTKLKLASPITGISSDALCLGTSGGEDEESDDSLRERLLHAMKTRPRCGSKDDYVYWTESVPGVRKAWVRPLHNGPGTVGIAWIEADGGQSDSVQERIMRHLQSLAPATAIAIPVILKRVPVKIDFAITPNTPKLLQDVTERLRLDFLRLSEPPGFFHYHEKKTLDVIPRSRLEDSIRSTPGVGTYEIHEIPKLTCNLGEILTLA